MPRNFVVTPFTPRPARPFPAPETASFIAPSVGGAVSTDHSIATPLWTIIKCGVFALGLSGGFMGIVLMAVQGWRPW
jgi:hypothetical protein